ncbi:ribonuclease HII [Candidatus Omnitrophota bacterium]
MAKRQKSPSNWNRHNAKLRRYERRLFPKKFKLIAGVDEAGRGPLAGPVVAAAVILKNYSFANRIFDSKKLSFVKRRDAFREITRQSFIGIGIIPNLVIDRVNILQATILAMKQALQALSVSAEFALIDGRFNDGLLPVPYRTVVKGDQLSLSIASASIVAKVLRDELMSYYSVVYPRYQFSSNRGYYSKAHLRAIRKYGITPIHRHSFYPVSKFVKFKR